jgi:hypothetical protein
LLCGVLALPADELQNLYLATNGSNWTNNTNWLSGDPCGNAWFGLTCENGTVVEIDLTDNNLEGTLPPTLNIPTLSILSLGYNFELKGDIPEYTSANLSEIYFNNTQVHGGFPSWFTKLPYLNTISLSSTNLSGDFPLSWCTMTQLQILSLGGQELTGTLPDCIGNLTSLQYLEIFTTPLHGEIPKSITNLEDLRFLELNYNLLTGEIPENIGQMKSLQRVTLYDNELSGSLPASLGDLNDLVEVRLRNNKLTGTIPENLQNALSLVSLGLESNYITGTIPEFFSPEIMPNLLTLDLRCNDFVGPLPEWLEDDPAMNNDIQVWFGCNNITTNELPMWCLDQTRCGQNACEGSRCDVPPEPDQKPNKIVIIVLACFLGFLLIGNMLLIVFLVRKKCMNQDTDTGELKPILGLSNSSSYRQF